MKNFKNAFLVLAFAIVGSTFIACGGSSENAEQQGKEYTSAYICPMHCDGSGSEDMGKCPVCGMDYVKNEEHKADGHSH